MSNKSISQKFFHTYGVEHDVEGCELLFSPEAMIYTNSSPAPLDLQSYKQLGYAFLNGIPDMTCNVIEQFEDGDRVISRVVYGGTHTGVLMGISATGRSFHSESIVIDRIVSGRIAERHEIGDNMGMMQQLGVIPAPVG